MTGREDTQKEKEAQRCVEDKKKCRFYRLSTRRFIPEGNEVSKVLIDLPSFTFHRYGSRLVDSSITMIIMSDSECAPVLKCLTTGDSRVLQYVMSNQ